MNSYINSLSSKIKKNSFLFRSLNVVNKKTVAVHSGSFHADDVFAVAALSLYLGYIPKIVRTRDEQQIKKADYVLDVGRVYDPLNNKFDHHGEGWNEKRDNGILYASVGLLWRSLGAQICPSKEVADIVDRKLIQIIDATDNGVEISRNIIPNVKAYNLSDIIYTFNPTWREKTNSDEAFLEAVPLARKILEREIIQAEDFLIGEQSVMDAYEKSKDKRIIVLDELYDYRVLENLPEPLLVIKPASSGTDWHINLVVVKGTSFDGRMIFPAEWAGKEGEDLQKITGITEAVFCHNKRFLVVCKTKEGAIKAAELAIKLTNL